MARLGHSCRLTLAAFAGALLCAADAAAEPGFKIVAHPSVPRAALSREEASRLFLKKSTAWEDGSPVAPVDQVAASPVRAEFSTAVHGRSVSAVKSYWQGLIFSGRGVPPPEAASDDAVLAAVRKTRGAVGYVSAATPVDGVKVLAFADGPPVAAGPRFLEPELVRKRRIVGQEPVYPKAALRNEEEGVLVARIEFTPDGAVAGATFQQTHPSFESTVRSALAAWRLPPELLQGLPGYTVIRFHFQLER